MTTPDVQITIIPSTGTPEQVVISFAGAATSATVPAVASTVLAPLPLLSRAGTASISNLVTDAFVVVPLLYGPAAFVDTNYTVSASIESDSDALEILRVVSKTTTSVTLHVGSRLTGLLAVPVSGTLDVTATSRGATVGGGGYGQGSYGSGLYGAGA